LATGSLGKKAPEAANRSEGMATKTSRHQVGNADGSILAVDYGRARIGLAIAKADAQLARPLLTLERVNRNEDMRRLRELAREHDVRQIVVGLPLRLDGTRGEMAEEATRFAARLRKQLGLPVDMLDERLTSWEAERLLEEHSGRVLHDAKTHAKSGNKPARASVDALAAAVILKEYLEQRRATQSDPERI
jgi:putative Holliday junction resolvase